MFHCLSRLHNLTGISRAEQQAERSRILADEEVNRIRGQLVSLGSMHHANDSAQLHSGSPKHAAHYPGVDRHGSLRIQAYKCCHVGLRSSLVRYIASPEVPNICPICTCCSQ